MNVTKKFGMKLNGCVDTFFVLYFYKALRYVEFLENI